MSTTEPPVQATYQEIEYGLLVPAEDNVRDSVGDVVELAGSIARSGLLQPLRVVALDDGRFLIIAGHRRHAAIGVLRNSKVFMQPVPCTVDPRAVEDNQRIEDMLIENMHRVDLNPIEEAHAFLRLTSEFKYKQADLAKAVSRSASYISSRIQLLKLPEVVIEQVRTAALPLEVAGELAKLGDDAKILSLTNNGNRVPTSNLVEQAKTEIKTAELRAKFEAAIELLGIQASTAYAPSQMSHKLLFETADPKEFGTLKVKIPKTAIAYLHVNSFMGSVSVKIMRPLTVAELEKLAELNEQKIAEMRTDIDKAHAERETEQRAKLSPAELAWTEECDRLRADHRAAVADWEKTVAAGKQAWASTIDAKSAARWAMIDLVTVNAHEVRDFLNLSDPDTRDVEQIVANYASLSAANLTQCVAAAMFRTARNEDDVDHDAIISYEKFIAKHVPFEPELVLPQHPDKIEAGQDDDDEQMSEEEAAAIAEERRRADEAFAG